jgi:hypothetical protein
MNNMRGKKKNYILLDIKYMSHNSAIQNINKKPHNVCEAEIRTSDTFFIHFKGKILGIRLLNKKNEYN